MGDLVRDKDGLTAALAFAVLAAQLKADGQTVPARLDALARRYGRHATRQWSLRMEGAAGQVLITTSVARLVNDSPAELAGRQVESVEQPAPDVIVLWLSGGARVVVRPSGTEPKLKCYLLAVLPGSAPVSEAEPLLDDLQSALEQYLSPTP